MPNAVAGLPLIDARQLRRGRKSTHAIAYWPGIIDLTRTDADIEYLVQSQRKAQTVHEADFELLRPLAGSQALLLDIGANCGQTILSAKAVCPDLRIHSVEPNPYAWPYLAAASKDFPDVTVGRHGLGLQEAVLTLWIPVIDGLLVSPLGSAHPETYLVDPMKSWLTEIAAGAPVSFAQAEIAIRRGDDLHVVPDVIKIDVEDHEIPVLGGLEQTILASRPLLIIEKSQPFRIAEHLRQSLGYAVYQHVANERLLIRLTITPDTPSETLPLNLVGLPEDRAKAWITRLGLRVRT